MNEQIQFIGVSPDKLIQELTKYLVPILTEQLAQQFQPKKPTEYLTQSQVCEMLHINRSSLHRWRKEGILEAFGISNRVYFKRESIDALINKNLLK